MDVEVVRGGPVPIIAVSGEVDHGSAPELADVVESSTQGQRIVLMDLSELRYMDSGGLSVLLRVMQRVRASGWLGIVDPSPNVMTLLNVVVAPGHGLRFFADREEALQAATESLPGHQPA